MAYGEWRMAYRVADGYLLSAIRYVLSAIRHRLSAIRHPAISVADQASLSNLARPQIYRVRLESDGFVHNVERACL